MKNTTISICTIMVALLCFRATTALNMNHICALVNDGLMIPSYNACDTYYMCSGGVSTLENCSSGNFFDKDTQSCMPQDLVNCTAVEINAPCLGYKTGTWAPAAGSCGGFYYCSPNGPVFSQCPDGETFDVSSQSCVYSSCSENISDGSDGSGETSVTVTINLCNFIKNGIFFGDTSNCGSWHECNSNILVSGICPTGQLYNVMKMSCDYADSVTCSQITNDPQLAGSTPPVIESCSVLNANKSATACNQYYLCDGQYYILTNCPSNLYYDTVSQTCVNRLNARNNCDRCVGVREGFVNQYSASNCTGYLVCQNGVEINTGFCPVGSNFNENTGACVETSTAPLFGCCNPKYYAAATSTTDADDGEATTDDSDSTNTTVASDSSAAGSST